MKVLVVYYSRTGYTKRVAHSLARRLNADLDEIGTDPRFGARGYLRCALESLLKLQTTIHTPQHDPAAYGLVLLGGPVWVWGLSSPLRSYLMLGWSHDVPTSGAAGLYVSRGFIQIAGFTFGKATSFFDIFPNASFAYAAGNNFSGDSGDGGADPVEVFADDVCRRGASATGAPRWPGGTTPRPRPALTRSVASC